MISTATIHEIDRLLKEGVLSQRQIARRLHVSRGTVSAIASGRRGLHGKELEPPRPYRSSSLPARCPVCGYRVISPCLICKTRDYRAAKRLQDRMDGVGTARLVRRSGVDLTCALRTPGEQLPAR